MSMTLCHVLVRLERRVTIGDEPDAVGFGTASASRLARHLIGIAGVGPGTGNPQQSCSTTGRLGIAKPVKLDGDSGLTSCRAVLMQNAFAHCSVQNADCVLDC